MCFNGKMSPKFGDASLFFANASSKFGDIFQSVVKWDTTILVESEFYQLVPLKKLSILSMLRIEEPSCHVTILHHHAILFC